jgi:microcompartment protein CcmL/EutN
VAGPVPAAPPVPALGDAVRDLVKAGTPAPAGEVVKSTVLPAPRQSVAKPLAAPAAIDNRAPIPVADTVPAASPVPALGDAVRDLAKATTPAPAGEVVKSTVLPMPREPLAKPLAAPAANDHRALLPVADRAPQRPEVRVPLANPVAPGGLGDVVRDMAKAVPPAPPLLEVAKPVKAEPVKVPAPKVEQAFTFAPSIPITVHGDVKDPEQLVRELEPPLRRLWEAFQRDVAARMSSTQLFDQPHV